MNAPAISTPPSTGGTRTDDEHEAFYRLYIVDGLSATQTAERLTALFPDRPMTKNAVVSYADRQGWEKSPESRGGTVTLPAPEKPSKAALAAPGPKSAVLADLDPIIGARQVAGEWADVRERSCRFPVGPRLPAWRMADQLFCGEAAEAGEPYCTPHCQVAYPPEVLARRRKADAAKN